MRNISHGAKCARILQKLGDAIEPGVWLSGDATQRQAVMLGPVGSRFWRVDFSDGKYVARSMHFEGHGKYRGEGATVCDREDVCAIYGLRGNAPEAVVSRQVYKFTECGGWLRFRRGGIEIGTIVEGSDACFSRTMDYPFTRKEYDDAWKEIEHDADVAWRDANG